MIGRYYPGNNENFDSRKESLLVYYKFLLFLYKEQEIELYCFLQYHAQILEFNDTAVKIIISKNKAQLAKNLIDFIEEYNNTKPNIAVTYSSDHLEHDTYSTLQKEFFNSTLGIIIKNSTLNFKVIDVVPLINQI